MTIENITDDNFEQLVIKSDSHVLVDYWAEWCGPCKTLSPILDELDKEVDNVSIKKLNIDDHPNAPTKYGVRGIPTLMLFNNGEVVGTKIGAASKTDLKEWLASIIE